jgi:hypothetical protein
MAQRIAAFQTRLADDPQRVMGQWTIPSALLLKVVPDQDYVLMNVSYMHMAAAYDLPLVIEALARAPHSLDPDAHAEMDGAMRMKEMPALLVAILCNSRRAIKALLDAGADYKHCSMADIDALLMACEFGDLSLVKYLSSLGVPVRTADRGFARHELSPIHLAVAHSNLPLFHFLIEQGEDIDLRSHGGIGDTPLQAAAHSGDLELLKLIIAMGADLFYESDDDKNALDMAEESGHSHIVAHLAPLFAAKYPQRSPLPLKVDDDDDFSPADRRRFRKLINAHMLVEERIEREEEERKDRELAAIKRAAVKARRVRRAEETAKAREAEKAQAAKAQAAAQAAKEEL